MENYLHQSCLKYFFDWSGKNHNDDTKRKIGEINSIKQTVESELKILDYFDKLKEVESTNLEVTKIKKEYVYTVNIDSCTFFDSINLSNDVPFATLKDFYKIYKGF